MDLSRTTALVTGAGDGLGAVIAEHLAAHSTFVIVADLDPEVATATAERIGGLPIQADVTRRKDRQRMVDSVALRPGPYLLINNAGGWGKEQYPSADEQVWRDAMELNLLAPMSLTKALLLSQRLACVVNVSSSAAREPVGYAAPEYAISKAGLIRMTTAMAGNADGVRLNCIMPGWIGLPRAIAQRDAMPADTRPELIDPHGIADEVVRLAADDSLDGQVLVMGS